MASGTADQNCRYSLKNPLYRITAQPAFDFPYGGCLLGGFYEKDCTSPHLGLRPYRRSLEPFRHLDTPTDQRTFHATSTLEPTPSRRGRQRAEARLVPWIAPFEPLNCPAVGVERHMANGLSREQRATDRIHEIPAGAGSVSSLH
jgi:hypothetical protein